jgi:ribose transport system ATP-binding protein
MAETILKMTDISKKFPGVLALDRASLEIEKGEVHILLGENGAGKSTLIRVLSGVYQKDGGVIDFAGKVIDNPSPRQMRDLGVSTIYQEFNLVPMLSVAENIFLGKEIMKKGAKERMDIKAMNVRAQQIMDGLGIRIDARQKVRNLSVAKQQMVEIAKALFEGTHIIIMDEPTAALTDKEIDTLFKMIKRLTAEGTSVIYISHRMEEFERVGDRITIMRDGKTIRTVKVAGTNREELIRLMVGREIRDIYPKINQRPGKELLRVEHLSTERISDVSFSLREGEILGVAGLMGSGRTELAKAIFGLDELTGGAIYIDGRPVRIHTPADAIKHGIALLPEDRQRQGLILVMNVMQNITINNLDQFVKTSVISYERELAAATEYIEKLNIRTPGPFQKVRNLSGGNQQKVVVAKWLLSHCKVIIFDEPTRGIDVGARHEIYMLMKQLVEGGAAVMMISSDLPEIIGLSTRVLVLADSRIGGEFQTSEATQEMILHYATGGMDA